ncbi:MAG: mechanosensitive ion channel [bacterium]|nr:mechanosensitive ion channel [bacterium]
MGKKRFIIGLLTLSVWFCLGGTAQLWAEPEPEPSPSASADEERQPEAIPVNKIGERIGRLTAQAHDVERILNDSHAAEEVRQQVAVISEKLSKFAEEHNNLLQSNTPSDIWYARTQQLEDYHRQVRDLAEVLQKRTEELQKLGEELTYGQEVWNLTKISVKSVKLNNSVIEDINKVLDTLSQYEEQVRRHQSELLNLQNEVFALNDSVEEQKKNLQAAIEEARSQVLQRNSDYLWVRLNAAVAQEAQETWYSSLKAQLHDLRVYGDKNSVKLVVYLLIFAVVWLILREVYRVVRPWGSHSGELQHAVRLVEMPIPIAALAAEACFLSGEGATLHIVKAIAGLVAIVPALIVLRRILDSYLTPLLNTVLIVYTLDMLNQLAYESPAVSRLFNLAEAVCMTVFLVCYLRSAVFASLAQIKGTRLHRVASIVGYGFLVFSCLAILANIVGYIELARRIVSILLLSTVSAFMLAAAAQFIVAMVLFFVTVPPLSLSNLVQIHRADILRLTKTILYWIALFIVLDNACGLAGYVGALRNLSQAVLDCHIAYGSVNVTIGQCLVAIAVLVISYQLSRLFTAVAECDVLPRWKLKSNASNVLLFFARYVPYIICFFIACAVLGLSVENLAMVVSALSVGIGFGLQNIINNFISGLILLFEPRIAVGGVVEFGNYSGVLVNVGMRASVVRMFDGREVIVPNSELISNKVVSITNTDAVPYRCSISFSLLGPVDIARVREVVEKCAAEHENVVSTPAPLLILDAMETGYPKFVLKFWTRSYDLLIVTQNNLSFQIVKRLQEEGWQLAGHKTELVSGEIEKSLPIVNTKDSSLP